jgi:hypothetical protein
MFQAVPPPIIRSSKLYTQHRVFVELFLLLTACSRKNKVEPKSEEKRPEELKDWNLRT